MSLGIFLKTARENAELSQLEVSKKLGYTSPQFISNWERGVSTPPLSQLNRISKIYRVDPDTTRETVVNFLVEEFKRKITQKFRNPAPKVEKKLQLCRIPIMDGINTKPSKDEVCSYAMKMARRAVGIKGRNFTSFQREEAASLGIMRVLEGYDKIDPEKNWQSWVYKTCEGAVLDFIRAGKGFPEQTTRRKNRAYICQITDEEDLDSYFARLGVFAENATSSISENWDLLCRLSSRDKNLEAFLRRHYLLQKLEAIGPAMGLHYSRVWGLFDEFVSRFKSGKWLRDPFFILTVHALGIAEQFDIGEEAIRWALAQKVIRGLEPIDLENLDPKSANHSPAVDGQLDFVFDEDTSSKLEAM